jgi:hypothetical protein
MKSAIRTVILAAIAAATGLVSTQSASAQKIFSRNTSADYVFPSNGATTTPNAVNLGNAGTYMLGGQLMIVNTGSQAAFAYCWMTAYGSSSVLPYGPASAATVPPGSWTTLPLNGWYQATGPTTLYVVCKSTTEGSSVMSTLGNITAALQ